MPVASVEELRCASRVLLHGVTGSGKTTAADLLGEALGLPSHHVDDEIGWLPGWVSRPADEQRQLAEALAAQDQWVLDSAYGPWRDLVLPRAEVVVALDYSRWLTLTRLLRRTARRLVSREEVCNGNRERLGSLFGSASIVSWHFQSFTRKRQGAAAMQMAPDGPGVLRLRHPRDLDRLLRDLRAPA